MPSLTHQENIPLSAEKIYQVITDYLSYPQFMNGVDRVSIIHEEGHESLVEYTLSLIKSTTYRLSMLHTPYSQVSWTLNESDIFKKNTGSWQLKDLGNGTTDVTYTIDADFKFMVPKMIIRKLLNNRTPKLFSELRERVETLEKTDT